MVSRAVRKHLISHLCGLGLARSGPLGAGLGDHLARSFWTILPGCEYLKSLQLVVCAVGGPLAPSRPFTRTDIAFCLPVVERLSFLC